MYHRLRFGMMIWLGLACTAACASGDKTQALRHVDHSVASPPSPDAQPEETSGSPTISPDSTPPIDPLMTSAIRAEVTPAPSVNRPPLPSQGYEQLFGVKLSPLEKAIMDDCPMRAWSQHVPKRQCKKDSECGDGFCDRGRCAAIWTCASDYGRRCEEDAQCGPRPCIDGRCRSCASEADCDWKLGRFRQYEGCRPDSLITEARLCMRPGLPVPPLSSARHPPPPPRALSQNVPDRACQKDSECGDGFCDRGRCAPLWEGSYGKPCTMSSQCRPYLCLDGRCRSCLHHAECNEFGNVCGNDWLSAVVPIAHACGGLGVHEDHMPPEPVRPPPPSTP